MIGTGYLGATHAAAMAFLGFEVLGVDVDESKVRSLTEGTVPFFEPGLQDLVRAGIAAGTLRFTTSLDDAFWLVKRVLPGWRMHSLQDQDGMYQTDNTATRWAVGISEKRGPGNVQSKAATPALALCAAILRATGSPR